MGEQNRVTAVSLAMVFISLTCGGLQGDIVEFGIQTLSDTYKFNLPISKIGPWVVFVFKTCPGFRTSRHDAVVSSSCPQPLFLHRIQA